MTFSLKSALKYLVLLFLGIGVLYLAFKGQDLSRIWKEIKSANFLWVIISTLTVLLAHVVRALRWKMLYHSIQYKVSFWNAYHAVMVGYLANLALPRFGEIGRCSVIHKTEKVPMFASIGTVITERLFDVLVLFLSGLIMLVFQYDVVYDFLYNGIYLAFTEKIKSVNYFWLFGLGFLVITILAAIIYFLRKKFSKKLLRTLVSLRQGFGSYGKMDQKGLFLGYTLLMWLLYFLSMYFAFSSIQATANLSFNAAFTALVFSSFAMVAPVQGGIGVFHWMVAKSLILYSVSFNDGLAYATIIHSSQVLLILLLGSLSLIRILVKRSIK